MAVRKLCTFKDPILKQKCSPIVEFDDNLRQLVIDMADTMQYNRGCGLAAPQIGQANQIVIVQKQRQKGLHIVVNPRITEKSEYTNYEQEGCLSYPEVFKRIERPNSVTVKGKNVQGKDISIHATGMEARIFCHECDHLNGCCKVAG